MNRWKSLWKGPTTMDSIEWSPPGKGYVEYGVWGSVGLYALDMDDRAWTFCTRNGGEGKWIRFEDLMSGAAGRQTIAELTPKEPDGT